MPCEICCNYVIKTDRLCKSMAEVKRDWISTRGRGKSTLFTAYGGINSLKDF
jgi:hypothetical protein